MYNVQCTMGKLLFFAALSVLLLLQLQMQMAEGWPKGQISTRLAQAVCQERDAFIQNPSELRAPRKEWLWMGNITCGWISNGGETFKTCDEAGQGYAVIPRKLPPSNRCAQFGCSQRSDGKFCWTICSTGYNWCYTTRDPSTKKLVPCQSSADCNMDWECGESCGY